MSDRRFAQANDQSRARLALLVATLTPALLSTDLGEGWTVGSAVAHIGFWDRWQLQRWTAMLAGTWSADSESVLAAEHLANEALHPYWAGIDASNVPALAVEAAATLDALIAGAPDALVDSLEGTSIAFLVHRHGHRNDHLDHIERVLAAAAGDSSTAPEALEAPDRSYLARNQASRARLLSLLENLTAADLAAKFGEGDWTVGQSLGHLAFWDRFLAARWSAALAAAPGTQPLVFPSELAGLLNDALPPTWLALAEGGGLIREVQEAAEQIDGIIATLPDIALVAEVLAERPALLDRSIHRSEHLDELARTLGGQRGARG